jgi:hypothetical protein
VSDLSNLNFDAMTPAEFEQYLPELFETSGGKVSDNPRLTKFLAANPDCAALVRDLETIADTARSLFEPTHDPSDDVWKNIASKLGSETAESEN